ncbi:hypothetical protein [Streptosporangium sp. NPDC000396]|uniref:hypothetical protein n=1 Tax=Streptosporangium sp. NPDC000396 TaxID=3366185 RepID=UPI0036CAF4F2
MPAAGQGAPLGQVDLLGEAVEGRLQFLLQWARSRAVPASVTAVVTPAGSVFCRGVIGGGRAGADRRGRAGDVRKQLGELVGVLPARVDTPGWITRDLGEPS